MNRGNWFALAFFLVLAYADFGRFRENLCHGPCPYGRFQGVMLDPNSLVLTYDAKRGEPRGFFRKGDERTAGSCIDCKMCVEVCPAGIDIRKGPQFECLSCMRCADACDTVMEKVGFSKHLIRLESENEVNGKPTRILRPRLFFYGVLLTFLVSSLTYLSLHHPVTQVDIVRTRSFVSQVLPDGRVANVYIIKALNMDDIAHAHQVEFEGLEAEVLGGNREIQAQAGEVVQMSVALAVTPSAQTPQVTRFSFKLREASTGKLLAAHPSTFIMPEDEDEKDKHEAN